MNFLINPVMQGSAGTQPPACDSLEYCGWIFIGSCDEVVCEGIFVRSLG
jgi:hypothetical protein